MLERPNTDVFLGLYHEFAPHIFAFLVTRTGHRPTAEDLASQVWIKAWQAWPKAHTNQPKAWVYRIARNTLIDHYRRVPDVAWEQLDGLVDHPTTTSHADLVEVQQALARLTWEQREIILLRVWEGLTFEEISTMLSIKVSAAKMRYQRGIASLGSLLTLITLFLYARY